MNDRSDRTETVGKVGGTQGHWRTNSEEEVKQYAPGQAQLAQTKSGSGIRYARQKKTPVAGAEQEVRDSVARMLPGGLPLCAYERVTQAIIGCVKTVVSEMSAIKTVAKVAVSNINRVTRNDDLYLLWTQNGEVIALEDCKMVRLFLMFVSNIRRVLSLEQIIQAERYGHYRLPPEPGARSNNDNALKAEDDDRYECQQRESSPGGRRGSWTGISRKERNVIEKSLRITIVQAGRDLKRAQADGNLEEVERIRQWRAALRDKKNELIADGLHRRSGPVRSKNEKEQIRRIQMAVMHFVEKIDRTDSALARHLDATINRNGEFKYLGDPRFRWEVCDNSLAAINRNRTPSRDDSQVSVSGGC